MRWLGKRLQKKKKTYSKDGEFKLCIINDNTDIMHETLGLTDERAEELAKICVKSFKKHSKTTDTLNEIYTHCTHINEVTMVLFMFHRIAELHSKDKIGSLLRNLFE